MSDSGPWQVIVVGGGPAGASAAWHCAQAGLSVCLVDRARFPRSKPCAEYLSPEGSRILDRMGALADLEQGAATYLTGMVVHAPAGGRIHGEFAAQHAYRGFRDRGLGIRREYLDALLLNRVRAAGVTVMEGARVTQLCRDADGTVNGVELTRDDEPQTLRTVHASLVVGADGLNSVVASRAGLAHRARWPRRVAYVAHYRNVARMGTLGEMHVTDNGYVGLAQVGDGDGASITNVALVLPRPCRR